jgi:ATP/maltotriose-dependent transcriptional regulator MalT
VGPALVPQALATTKLRTPRTRPNLVDRPRLRDVLVAGQGRRLTLVSAPAGFSNTTLLGEWAEDLSAAGRSVAWVSLDGSDNDPTRFMAYLVVALRAVSTPRSTLRTMPPTMALDIRREWFSRSARLEGRGKGAPR